MARDLSLVVIRFGLVWFAELHAQPSALPPTERAVRLTITRRVWLTVGGSNLMGARLFHRRSETHLGRYH